MPLSINVGLSRKASRDYQSTGVSINVTAELDQSLLGRPQDLQQQIGDLYAQARQALEQQAGSAARPQPPQSRSQPGRSNGSHDRAGARNNGNGNGNDHGGAMTRSQRNAILAIARRVEADPEYEANQIIGVPLERLTVRQASELIDHLKSLTPADNGR